MRCAIHRGSPEIAEFWAPKWPGWVGQSDSGQIVNKSNSHNCCGSACIPHNMPVVPKHLLADCVGRGGLGTQPDLYLETETPNRLCLKSFRQLCSLAVRSFPRHLFRSQRRPSGYPTFYLPAQQRRDGGQQFLSNTSQKIPRPEIGLIGWRAGLVGMHCRPVGILGRSG